MAEGRVASLASLGQVASVVVGVVISVLSFNATRQKEADARQIEAARPFLDLRQEVYKETVRTAAVLADPKFHTTDEVAAARKRFRALYIAELSMVEARCVELQMVELAKQVDPELAAFTPAQAAAYALSHALRDSYARTFEAVRELDNCGDSK
jgi:hypothetical protein